MSWFQTLQHITSIIDKNYSNDILALKLKSKNIDFETLVKTGSQQLIIPAIYLNLEYKNLLKYLPEDLVAYLKEITRLNEVRNIEILKETQFISTLFKKHNINHVFLKGAALLASGYYNSIAERMVGDIDLLVDKNQLLDAELLLKEKGYENYHSDIEYKHLNHRHLPRLISPNKIGAIEIHRNLLEFGENKDFNSFDVLKDRELVNKVYIGSRKNLLLHNIYNFQINSKGYYYNNFNLRNAYDCNLLINDKIKLPLDKYTKDFLNKFNLFFKNSKTTKSSFRVRRYVFKQKNPLFSKYNSLFLKYSKHTKTFTKIYYMFVTNPSFRKDYLKKEKLQIP